MVGCALIITKVHRPSRDGGTKVDTQGYFSCTNKSHFYTHQNASHAFYPFFLVASWPLDRASGQSAVCSLQHTLRPPLYSHCQASLEFQGEILVLGHVRRWRVRGPRARGQRSGHSKDLNHFGTAKVQVPARARRPSIMSVAPRVITANFN